MSQRLGPIDINFWTIHSPTTQQVIASYCPLDSAPDIEAVRQAITEQLAFFPRFRQRVVRKFLLHWEDDAAFDIADHVRLISVPEATTPEALAKVAEEKFSSPMDTSRPPWDFTVFVGGGQAPPVGVLFRIHHALADGLGGLEFFHRVCHTERLSPSHREQHSGGEKSGRTSKTPARFGVDFWRSFRRLLSDTRVKTGRSALNGPNSASREFSFLELPLEELRTLRRQIGASLNDLLLSMVASAVGRYQEVRHAPLESVKVLMPFSLRRRQDSAALGNHLTGVGVNLPLGRSDVKERTKTIRDTINRMKIDGSIGAFRLLAVIIAYLPAKLRRRISRAAARRTNFICTNMPGPEQPLYLCGSRLLGNFGCAALMQEHGVAFGFISYAGKMCISIVSDPAVVPEPGQLVRFLRESFEEIRSSSRGSSAQSDLIATAAQ